MPKAKLAPRWLTPLSVTATLSLLLLGLVLSAANWDPLELARVGTRFSQGIASGSEGYDGQFVYYIATDPAPQHVAAHLDVPAYRYQRILLPLLARVLSLQSAKLIPWMLPLINLCAHLWAVHLLSRLFKSWGVSAWYALPYGLWVGNLLALRLDLPEPLAFGLVLTAFTFSQNKRAGWAAVLYSLALFAKETAIFFVAAQGLVFLAQRRWKGFAVLGVVTGLPFIAFRLWMLNAFGSFGFGLGGAGATGLEFIPFNGLLRVAEYDRVFQLALAAVYIPAVLLPAVWGFIAGIRRWLAAPTEFTPAAVFLNAAIYPFLPLSLYIEPLGTLRLATGLQLAVLMFAARNKIRRVLNYSPFWIVLDVLLIRQLFA
jgi:hypothetical protein